MRPVTLYKRIVFDRWVFGQCRISGIEKNWGLVLRGSQEQLCFVASFRVDRRPNVRAQRLPQPGTQPDNVLSAERIRMVVEAGESIIGISVAAINFTSHGATSWHRLSHLSMRVSQIPALVFASEEVGSAWPSTELRRGVLSVNSHELILRLWACGSGE